MLIMRSIISRCRGSPSSKTKGTQAKRVLWITSLQRSSCAPQRPGHAAGKVASVHILLYLRDLGMLRERWQVLCQVCAPDFWLQWVAISLQSWVFTFSDMALRRDLTYRSRMYKSIQWNPWVYVLTNFSDSSGFLSNQMLGLIMSDLFLKMSLSVDQVLCLRRDFRPIKHFHAQCFFKGRGQCWV